MRERYISLLILLVAIPYCATTGADAKEVPGPSDKHGVTHEAAVASAWLDAVRDKDAAKVVRISGVPFVEANLRNHKGCTSKGYIQTTADLRRFADCVVGYALLVDSIPASAESEGWEPVSLESVSKKFRSKLKRLAVDHAFLQGHVMGDGLTFTILMAIRRNGMVDAVLSEVEVVE